MDDDLINSDKNLEKYKTDVDLPNERSHLFILCVIYFIHK